MVKGNEKTKQKAILDYMQSSHEFYEKYHKTKKIKFLIIALIVFAIIMIKIFFGVIEIPNIFGYPPSNARFYKVKINNEQISVSYDLKHAFPIIPFLIHFNSYYLGNSDIYGTDTGPFFKQNGSDKYIIDISSYSCYWKNIQVECKNTKQEMKENKDTKYTNLTITRITNPYEIIYDGKYIDDFTNYVKEKGEYAVVITAKYGLTESKVYFYFENFK